MTNKTQIRTNKDLEEILDLYKGMPKVQEYYLSEASKDIGVYRDIRPSDKKFEDVCRIALDEKVIETIKFYEKTRENLGACVASYITDYGKKLSEALIDKETIDAVKILEQKEGMWGITNGTTYFLGKHFLDTELCHDNMYNGLQANVERLMWFLIKENKFSPKGTLKFAEEFKGRICGI